VCAVPVRIVVLEDDPDCRELFRSVLELEGYAVVPVPTLAQLATVVAQTPADLIIADLFLPDVPPEQVLAGLTTLADSTPVLLCTAATPAAVDAVRWQRRPTWELVAKPFDLGTLLARIAQLLDGQPALAALG
jgi:DNA-binding response OmpR family regulator